jgi:hypothetical protein
MIGHQDPEAPVWQVRSQFAMATAEQGGRWKTTFSKTNSTKPQTVAAPLKAEISIHCNANNS